MQIRKRAVAVATAVLLTAGATGVALAPAASAGPRAADSSAAYFGIDGGGSYVGDDWQDEYDLGVGEDQYSESNATALWETVLYADGAQWEDEDGDLHPFRKNDIDGSFGEKTESATQWWQEQRGLGDRDGVVTEETWRRAQQSLSGVYSGNKVKYFGTTRNIDFKRVSGKYRVYYQGSWKNASYDQRG